MKNNINLIHQRYIAIIVALFLICLFLGFWEHNAQILLKNEREACNKYYQMVKKYEQKN